MAAATSDPHKIAPIVCATMFGGLDVLFNALRPEDRDKILDTLCQCGNTIKESNSFETTFFNRSHPSIARKVVQLQTLLRRQYLTALTFACKVRERCEDMQFDFMSSDEYTCKEYQKDGMASWFKCRGSLLWHKMSNEVLEWEGGLKELARLKTEWAVMKDDVKESIALDAHTNTVRTWLRKGGCPDPSPSDIRSRVMPDDRYPNGADWFLDGDPFQAFCAGFDHSADTDGVTLTLPFEDQDVIPADTSQRSQATKRVLWLRGGLGTGKTTVLSLAFAHLSTFRDPVSENGAMIRIVPYFCDGSETSNKRPDCVAMIRAMIRRMALQTDGTLAEAANDFHHLHQHSAAEDKELTRTEDWSDLFEDLLKAAGSGCHFVVLVDALDECDKPKDWKDLLKVMSGITKSYRNVSFLCSSHAHVTVEKFFKNANQDSSIVTVEDVNAGRNGVALSAYVNSEIERRKADAARRTCDEECIFYISDFEDLLDQVRDTLLRNARGVFQWAKIWLDILFAEADFDRTTITSEVDAQKWLDRLERDSRESTNEHELLTKGYQRLWDITCIRGRDDFEQRTRLFHFVLAAPAPVTAHMLSTALRIRGDKLDRSPKSATIMRLCSNFLSPRGSEEYFGLRLEFVHSSAYNFVRDLDMKQTKLAEGDEERYFSDHRNHESIARLYMDLVASVAHPYWAELDIKIQKWSDYADHRNGTHLIRLNLSYLQASANRDGEIAGYLINCGLMHIINAARSGSLDDPIWKDFVQRLLLPSDSALGACLLGIDNYWIAPEYFTRAPLEIIGSTSCLRLEDGRLRILPSHVLAGLPIFDKYARPLQISTYVAIEDDKCARLLRDVCTLGGNFIFQFQFTRREDRLIPGQTQPEIGNALSRACGSGNLGAVRAILHVAKLSSDYNLSELLYFKTFRTCHPLLSAISSDSFAIACLLLEVDRQPVNESAEVHASEGSPREYWSSLWEIKEKWDPKPWPLLKRAAVVFNQAEMISFLEVAGPKNINALDRTSRQTLLDYAKEKKKDVLANKLVKMGALQGKDVLAGIVIKDGASEELE